MWTKSLVTVPGWYPVAYQSAARLGNGYDELVWVYAMWRMGPDEEDLERGLDGYVSIWRWDQPMPQPPDAPVHSLVAQRGKG